MGQLKGSCDEAASSKADESAMDSILARRVADRKVTLARKSPMQVSRWCLGFPRHDAPYIYIMYFNLSAF